MIVKSGIKTREVILTVLTLVLAAVGKFIPGFPAEVGTAIMAISSWVLTRGLEKFLTPIGAAKDPAWKTTEFWVALLFSGAAVTFPEMPTESIGLLWAYLGSRLAAKKGAEG